MMADVRMPSPVGWLLLLAVGIFAQLGQIFLTKGLHAERAGRAMTMSYVQIVFAALWGVFFFGGNSGTVEYSWSASGGGGDAGGVGRPKGCAETLCRTRREVTLERTR